MSRRARGAGARAIEVVTEEVPVPLAWEREEDDFFRNGDAGRFEPPVYLPTISILVPFAGIAFLAALTVIALH